MRRISLIVPVLALAFVGVAFDRAEAARIGFNGAGGRGGVVWDDGGDVSTMSNQCGDKEEDPIVCFTTLGISTLAVQFSSDTPSQLDAITDVYLVMSVTGAPPATCAAGGICTSLASFASLMNDTSNWETRTVNPGDPANDRVNSSTQTVIALQTNAPTAAGLFTLTDASTAFLTALAATNPTLVANAHVGIYARWDVGLENIAFALETVRDTKPVPEPGTLALMAMGLAGALGVRRRVIG